MRKSNGHLSNKNILSNFLKEFLLREESFNQAIISILNHENPVLAWYKTTPTVSSSFLDISWNIQAQKRKMHKQHEY